MNTEIAEKTAKQVVDEREGLISILERIQSRYNYLPEKALREVAEQTGISLVDVYGVASFYRAFSLKPRGKHLVACCLGTACHVREGPSVARALEKELGISAGETTEDKVFTLEAVNCLGACALGPIVVADGRYFSKVKPSGIKEILKQTREGLDKVDTKGDKRIIPLEVRCPRCNHTLMDPNHVMDGYQAVRVTISFENRHGWMCLSSLYGSSAVSSQYAVPEGAIASFFCPHCHNELLGSTACPECGVRMVPMIVRGGGMVQVCPRRGCKGHRLDLNGVNL
jgi:NADH-quinone oxidoreductase subunit E